MSDASNPATLEHNVDASLQIPLRKFAHLHQHTQFSFPDGAAQVKDLLKRVLKTSESSPTVAMTDHGNMHGAVTFFKYATEMGVKPIIRCKVFVAAVMSRFMFLSAHAFLLLQNICVVQKIGMMFSEDSKSKKGVPAIVSKSLSGQGTGVTGNIRKEVFKFLNCQVFDHPQNLPRSDYRSLCSFVTIPGLLFGRS